jgi:hypothetical protein
VKVLLWGAMLLFSVAFPIRLQAEDRFGVTGTAHDSSGAVIPGALVSVLTSSGSAVQNVRSDAEGIFRVQLQTPGTYRVHVEAEGFVPFTSEVILTSDHLSENVDVTMNVAGSTQSVEVTADALAAETTSTQLGEVLDTAKIDSLPLNGRSFTISWPSSRASFPRTPHNQERSS